LKDQLGTQDLFRNFTISDYFIIKSLIFARKTLPADELALFTRFFNFITASLPKPDLLVYLYLEVDKLQFNIRQRGRSYEQQIKDEYLEKIQTGYFEYMKQQIDLRILVLDTNKLDFVNNASDYRTIMSVIDKDYSIGIHRVTF
jgi:deoxyadenosine/deoxycytidine kinase